MSINFLLPPAYSILHIPVTYLDQLLRVCDVARRQHSYTARSIIPSIDRSSFVSRRCSLLLSSGTHCHRTFSLFHLYPSSANDSSHCASTNLCMTYYCDSFVSIPYYAFVDLEIVIDISHVNKL